MKNIHVLPTDKPSRLFYNVGGALLFTDYQNYNGVNIYITCDEEIKDGDWCFYLGRFGAKIVCKAKLTDTGFVYQEFGEDYVGREDEGITPLKSEIFKIILTTDQDLIKDGVQAIDDEFLEWFVKNPNCESVKVEKQFKPFSFEVYSYKIIIPKEEPKQEFPKQNIIDNWLEKNGDAEIDKQVEQESKCLCEQETLEDAAIDYSKMYFSENKKAELGFIAGAKWQQEQDKNKYSEEEVLEILNKRVFDLKHKKDIKTNKEWFEQFKTNKI